MFVLALVLLLVALLLLVLGFKAGLTQRKNCPRMLFWIHLLLRYWLFGFVKVLLALDAAIAWRQALQLPKSPGKSNIVQSILIDSL